MQFEGYYFKKKEEEGSITLSQNRSDVGLQDMTQLKILELDHAYLLETKISWDETHICYQFKQPPLVITWEELANRSVSERLRILLNCLQLEELLVFDLTFFLSPENIILDINGIPKLLYRGLKTFQPPFQFDQEPLLRQFKSLIVAQFSPLDFAALYEGGLEVPVKESPFLRRVKEANSTAELKEILLAEYQTEACKEVKTTQTVSRGYFRLSRQLIVWLGLLALLLVIPLVYLAFVREPFHASLQAADEAFLKSDYSSVIEELETISVADMPKTQKYTLAYSYIHLMNLSAQSRKNILNNVSLIADERFLDYWIYDGRGDYDHSLEIAKSLKGYQFIAHALRQKIVQVRNDRQSDQLSRRRKLAELEAELKQYEDVREDTQTSERSSTEGQDKNDSKASSDIRPRD